MKKRDPNKVIDEFQSYIESSAGVWGEIGHRVGWESSLAKALSVDAFLRAAVSWETFRSDWHVAAINQDASAFRQELLKRFRASTEEKWAGLTTWVSVEIPKHPSLTVVGDLIDSKGYNVTFSTSEKWVDRSARELVDPWRAAVLGLPPADRSFLDAVAALRDCIAHRSTGSTSRLDQALKKLNVAPDKGLRRGKNRVQPSGIGTYLFAVAGPATARRVQLFHARLSDIADGLRVT